METLDEVITNLGDAPEHLCSMMVSKETWHDALEWLIGYRAHIELDKLRDKCEAENNPLSWDELKQMEGKPVWVEEKYSFCDEWHGQWEVIRSVWDDEFEDEPYLWMTDDENRHKDTLGEIWQAYRKERGDATL